MAFDVNSAVASMLEAARAPLATGWKEAEPLAKTQFTIIAHTVAGISEARAANQITREQACYLFSLQQHATKSALLAVEGLGLVAVEAAINGALAAVSGVVTAAVGFPLF